jgi:hypothetical protein
MTVRSWGGVIAGVVVALLVPISYRVFAQLLEAGVVRVEREGSIMQTLTTIAFTELLLGPIGVAIAGRALGLRSPVAWLVLFGLTIPVLAVVWLICFLTLSGALGRPI